MHRKPFSKFRTWALTGVAIAAIAGPAAAEEAKTFTIPSQSLVTALEAFGKQGDKEILFSKAQAEGHAAPAVSGIYEPQQALAMLLNSSGLKFRQVNDNTFVVEAADPQSGSAAGDGADGTVAALIVTAQKREEQIQDVPIAISAFTEKSLEEQKIEGGFDLLKAIPNVTFSKNNFTSYNFSIRGIGTKAVSATTDPGVAVSFNNIALLQNRLFEQEYFDVERVEVLRGPQGTLYGRNATAGVVNVITAKPNLQEFSGWIKGEVGNYNAKRLSAMVNVPLAQDKLAIRIAAALTDRSGYDYNDVTKHAVNGRDLWSGRVTVQFNPTERLRSNLVWERFNENDNRSRTGKQLCHRDNGPQWVRDAFANTNDLFANFVPAIYSQGCKPGSLYDDSAFGTPNGLSLPFYLGMILLGADCGQGCTALFPLGVTEPPINPDGTYNPNARPQTLVNGSDPYAGAMQSRDLRRISSFRDPVYRAKADVIQFNIDFDLTTSLRLYSQTVYNKDSTYSFQDYNRFNTAPIFNDTSKLYNQISNIPSSWVNMAPGGVFCDPQLGCSKTMAGFDIASAKGSQFGQEIRLQSSFDGPINFSAGANYTKFKVEANYYVMFNLITALAYMKPFYGVPDGKQYDPSRCYVTGVFLEPTDVPQGDPTASCIYVDPNPVESINGEGHNYFRSKNPYKLDSRAAFGEVYWQINDALKLTAGLRYTDDKKIFIPVPSQLLLATSLFGLGSVSRGYPEQPPIRQEWREWTGRLGLDWKPDLSFTDQSLLYAFYSRGYKGGGANPPSIGFGGFIWDYLGFKLPRSYADTFKPEFVNSFEVGSKNTLMGGGLMFNATAFYYDYKDYQVSQILDRLAVNENFDARVWGLEFETLFNPTRNLHINANLGYLDSRIADGEKSIDTMNRTQSNPNYMVVRPWPQLPSNCVIPTTVVQQWVQSALANSDVAFGSFCLKGIQGVIIDPATNDIYDPANYPDLNGGLGLYADLGGNELPNSPHWTANVGAQYGHDILDGSWRANVRADAYWQSQSWARVYNAVNDKLHGWYNVNLSVWLEKPEDDLKIELYAKNILDKTPITDAFLNSDDTALTTNVFVLDPRLIGLSIKKGF